MPSGRREGPPLTNAAEDRLRTLKITTDLRNIKVIDDLEKSNKAITQNVAEVNVLIITLHCSTELMLLLKGRVHVCPVLKPNTPKEQKNLAFHQQEIFTTSI